MDPELQANLDRIVASPSYQLAELDTDFLTRPELRPTRMQLELRKPEMTLTEHGVESTVVVFGGTQVVAADEAERRVAAAEAALQADPDDAEAQRQLQRAQRMAAKSKYYEAAREFASIVSSVCQTQGMCDYVIKTGGGPGIMEAANRGAYEVKAKSIGLNITLPDEQFPNPYITPELCFQFHYFAMRKMHFLLRAKALVIFPGGFGTLDELFDALTLRQVGRMQEIPIILFGRDYWERVIDFQFLADEGVIRDAHLDLIQYAETPQEAWDLIVAFHGD
ncbi:MAG: TIGR00730 family Rossman fold protein [Planctomycetota bacterium]